MSRVVVCAVIMANVCVVCVSKLGGAVSTVCHPEEAIAQILISDEQACINTGRNHNSTQSDSNRNLLFSQHSSDESAVSDFVHLRFSGCFWSTVASF